MNKADTQEVPVSEQPNTQKNSSRPSLGRIVQSTLAGALGVQSSKNREKDFANGNIWVFIVSGVIFTALFIFGVMTLVRLAISAAG